MTQQIALITDIEFDLDKVDEAFLPLTLIALLDTESDEPIEDQAAEHISTVTGYCHKSFKVELLTLEQAIKRQNEVESLACRLAMFGTWTNEYTEARNDFHRLFPFAY